VDSNFCLEQGKPGAYTTYRNVIFSLLYFSMHMMYCALRVGFFDDIVICYMVVPLPYVILVVVVLLLYN
jgi:hypothetical protein